MKKLVGNKHASEMLLRLVARDRVPSALLFDGPEGVGKRQFALELARSLVCIAAHDCEGCGECSACTRVGVFSLPTSEKGDDYERVFLSQHPDVGIVIPYKRNLRVDAIRDLEREAYFRPYEAKARVFIVDDADKMNDAASNALLKTLEEPPSTSHIILLSSRADSLLATIRSRCQTIRFGPVGYGEIERYLIAIGDFSPDDAALAARVSGGSIGRAMSIVPASFRTQRSLMLDVLKAAIAGNRRELLAASEEMTDAKNKEEYDEKLVVLQNLIHDVWLLEHGMDEGEIRNREIVSELRDLTERVPSSALSRWLEEIEAMRENFIVNINRKVATDELFIKMAA